MVVHRLLCPSCQTAIRSKQPLPVGSKVRCPGCGKPFAVPVPEDELQGGNGHARKMPEAGDEVIPDDVGLAPEADKPAAAKREELTEEIIDAEVVEELPAVVRASCPKCGFGGNVPRKYVGKQVKCKKCATLITVTDPANVKKAEKPAEEEPVEAEVAEEGNAFASLEDQPVVPRPRPKRREEAKPERLRKKQKEKAVLQWG